MKTQASKHRIDGQFYPVQREELLKIRKLKLINNTAFVYLALKYENPFCDRPIEIQVAEFCLRWGLPESSLYKAVAALKEHNALKICNRTISIEWAESTENSFSHSQQALATRNGELILGSENGLSDPRMDIYIDRARGSDSSEISDPPLPPTGELDGGEINFLLEPEAVPNYLSSMQDRSNELEEARGMDKGGFSAAGAGVEFHQKNISVQTHSAPVEFHQEDILVKQSSAGTPVEFHQEHIRVETFDGAVTFHQKHIRVEQYPIELETFPRSLLEKAKELGIKFDNEVVAAIKEHHQSQFMGVLKAMESYSGEIKYPNKYLLKKLPKMPKERLGLVMPLVDTSWLEKKGDPMPDTVKTQWREYQKSLNLKQA